MKTECFSTATSFIDVIVIKNSNISDKEAIEMAITLLKEEYVE